MKKINVWFLATMLLSIGSFNAIHAQHSGDLGGNWNNPAGGRITNIITDRYARQRQQKRPAVKHSTAGSTTGSDDAAVRFRSTGTQLKTREIANLISPGDAQVFTILTTILQEFDKEAQKIGKPNDLALALSFFFATNASVYHDAGVPPDPQMLELRDTLADALVEGNALNGVTDRKKQEMYEALVLYTGLALASYEEGKQGNAGSLKIAQQLAGANLLAVTGISPDKISFTNQGLSIDNGSNTGDASASVAADSRAAPTPTIQNDPFPVPPGYSPDPPYTGTVKLTITMADLVGTWNQGAGSVQRYIDSYTGDYAGTTVAFYGEEYIIKSDGTFTYKFTGRANNTTVRESDRGKVILGGAFITIKFEGTRGTKKYQFIAFMTGPNGAAVLTLVEVGENGKAFDADWIGLECGHPKSYPSCVGGEEWARLGVKPAK